MDFDNFPVDVIWQLSGSLFCWIFEEGGPLISISLEKSKRRIILEHISKYTYEHWFQTKIVSRRFSFQCLTKIRDPASDTFFFITFWTLQALYQWIDGNLLYVLPETKKIRCTQQIHCELFWIILFRKYLYTSLDPKTNTGHFYWQEWCGFTFEF